MDWIFYSGLMYIFSVVNYLALRKLQKNKVPNDLNNVFMFVFGALFFAAITLINNENLFIDFKLIAILFTVTFLFSYLGNKFSLAAIEAAPNPGYSLTIQKSFSIYTVIASVFLFNSELTFKSIFAILIIIFFLGLMTLEKGFSFRKIKSQDWVVLSFLAFFGFGNLSLASKWLLNEGVTPLVRSFYVSFFVCSMFIVDLIVKSRKNTQVIESLKIKSNYVWFFFAGLGWSLFNLYMQYAFQIAPNIGYVNAINAASITPITILSAIIYKDHLSLKKIAGIVGVTIGLVLLLL